jgi:hypothetical protein
MQIKNLSLTVAATFLLACTNSNDVKEAVVKAAENPDTLAALTETLAPEPQEVWQDTTGICGFYVGSFSAEKFGSGKKPMYSNKINLAIDSVVGKKVYGHSVVAGNIRPFFGKIMDESAKTMEIEAKEPGDDKYDGTFIFTILKGLGKVQGIWVANDQKLAVTQRKYDLGKDYFAYDPKQELGNNYSGEVYDSYDEGTSRSESITADANKFNASMVELKSADIENMYKRDLEVMRNAIYARHGYSFKNRAMRAFFDQEIAWYIPVSVDVTAQLTELEKKNIDLIKTYEQHATTYYDRFGR